MRISLKFSAIGMDGRGRMIGLLLVVALACIEFNLGIPDHGLAVDGAASPAMKDQGSRQSDEPYMPVYHPRKGTSLTGRVDGGFRGGKEGEPVLKVLAPDDHVGETLHKSPALYWYLSQRTDYPIYFTLEDSRHWKPVLEVTLKPPIEAGVQIIRLADYGKTLEAGPEVQYRWHLSIVPDPESRSKDIHAMGIIERVPYDQAIFEQRACRNPRDVFCLYVESGLWYDAVQVISDLILANPRDRVLRLQRAALLDKVGLTDVAEHDRTEHGRP
jgi:hypothetical protein